MTRNQHIYAARQSGCTYKAIAESYGLSISRVFAICRQEAQTHQQESETANQAQVLRRLDNISKRLDALMHYVSRGQLTGHTYDYTTSH